MTARGHEAGSATGASSTHHTPSGYAVGDLAGDLRPPGASCPRRPPRPASPAGDVASRSASSASSASRPDEAGQLARAGCWAARRASAAAGTAPAAPGAPAGTPARAGAGPSAGARPAAAARAPSGQAVDEQIGGRRREQHLAAVRQRPQPGAADDARPDVVRPSRSCASPVCSAIRTASVRAGRPGLVGQRPLGVQGRGHARRWRGRRPRPCCRPRPARPGRTPAVPRPRPRRGSRSAGATACGHRVRRGLPAPGRPPMSVSRNVTVPVGRAPGFTMPGSLAGRRPRTSADRHIHGPKICRSGDVVPSRRPPGSTISHLCDGQEEGMGKKVLSAISVVLGVVGPLELSPTDCGLRRGRATARSRFRSSRLIAGLSTEGNSGVFHTHTESGRIDCGQGRTGTIGVDGRYGTAGPASCQQGGEGWGVFSVTLSNRQFKDAFTVPVRPTPARGCPGRRGDRRTDRREVHLHRDRGELRDVTHHQGSRQVHLRHREAVTVRGSAWANTWIIWGGERAGSTMLAEGGGHAAR